MEDAETLPSHGVVGDESDHPVPIIVPHVATHDGSEFVHKDLLRVVEPWAVADHIDSPRGVLAMQDLPSLARFIRTYGTQAKTLIMWSGDQAGSGGIDAVLDYHEPVPNGIEPDRAQFGASFPFRLHPQFQIWKTLLDAPHKQAQAVELIESVFDTIKAPEPAVLIEILSKLRSTSTSEAFSQLRPDGTYHVTFSENATVTAGAPDSESVDLPREFEIKVPVLNGHIEWSEEHNRFLPVRYKMVVHPRVNVGRGELALRFSIFNLESIFEDVYADILSKFAVDLRGESDTEAGGYRIYRGGDQRRPSQVVGAASR